MALLILGQHSNLLYKQKLVPNSRSPSSMSSFRRKFNVKQPVVVDVGCSCRKLKLSSFFSKQKKSHTRYTNFSPSTSNTTTNPNTTSSFSPSYYDTTSPKRTVKKKSKKVVEESVAVEKESHDPYLDFKNSMLQMIVEKEIYHWNDLVELLHLFLSLNASCHHHVINRAFGEICNGVF